MAARKSAALLDLYWTAESQLYTWTAGLLSTPSFGTQVLYASYSWTTQHTLAAAQHRQWRITCDPQHDMALVPTMSAHGQALHLAIHLGHDEGLNLGQATLGRCNSWLEYYPNLA